MGKETGISWTDHTFNPWIGCTRVSQGCVNCYAESQDHRWGHDSWGPGKPRRVTSNNNWKQPLNWAGEAADDGVRRRVFCASLADVFDSEAPIEARRRLWSLIQQTHYSLDWLLLTKRPERIGIVALEEDHLGTQFFVENQCWIGTTTENQEMAEKRIPEILMVPAAVRFISAEPLLGPLDLEKILTCNCSLKGDPYKAPEQHAYGCPSNYRNRLDWCITGGESGSGARPMLTEWVDSIRKQCEESGVTFFHKQNGEYVDAGHEEFGKLPSAPLVHIRSDGTLWNEDELPEDENADVNTCKRVGKKRSGHLLYGKEYHEFPGVK